MAIPISIDKLLDENVVEWARIEFKEGFNPDSILKTISAFANDIDNLGGGYIIVGAKEKDSRLERPVKGIEKNSIDSIQKEILRYCKFLKPAYIPVVEPVIYDNKMLLLIWCPGGYDRPYACPKVPSSKGSEKIYYIRKLSSTIEATNSDFRELMELSNNVPFDDRLNLSADISDLSAPIIRNYLFEIGSKLYKDSDKQQIEGLAASLRIAGGPSEWYKPINVGLLFFNDRPSDFFPYTRIELVNIPDPTGQGMEERIYDGPIHEQLRAVLRYIRTNVIAEKVFKVSGQAESKRVTNYSYEALEEFLSNAVYHKSYQIYEPITVRIEKNEIRITSVPGPDRSISDEDIKNFTMRTDRYRNRRIGDFLKELHLSEGRNTGIPTAIAKIKANGSPLPIFLTDENRSYFTVIVPIHEDFVPKDKKGIKKVRKTRYEIQEDMMEILTEKDMSAAGLYSSLGYSGNPSKTFRNMVNDLIEDGQIEYISKNKKASNNVLHKKR